MRLTSVVAVRRPEVAAPFRVGRPSAHLALARTTTTGSEKQLLPVAIALFLVVLGAGSHLRLTAQLRRRPEWR